MIETSGNNKDIIKQDCEPELRQLREFLKQDIMDTKTVSSSIEEFEEDIQYLKEYHTFVEGNTMYQEYDETREYLSGCVSSLVDNIINELGFRSGQPTKETSEREIIKQKHELELRQLKEFLKQDIMSAKAISSSAEEFEQDIQYLKDYHTFVEGNTMYQEYDETREYLSGCVPSLIDTILYNTVSYPH